MTTINSVLGPMDTADLGFTLMHEHILCGPAAILRDYPELLGDTDNLMTRVVDALNATKAGGVDTFVDLTTLDLGRNIPLLVDASKATGVNILATTGWWLDIPRWFDGVTPDQMARVFIREATVGMAGTDVKAALLKSASDLEGVTPKAEMMIRAIARAHHETNLPIILHSYSPGQVARRQLEILKEEGVELNRVKVDHSNDTMDMDYLLWILDQGCYLGMDRYPGRGVSPYGRTQTLKALIDAGFADRVCPSHDSITLMVIGENPHFIEQIQRARKANPHGYLFMKEVVFKQLLEEGISQETVDNLCVVGPRNFLEGK